MDKSKFIYTDKKGFIDINTLGPSQQFYYKIQKPISINMSNFGCKIAFYKMNGELIYHRNEAYAHWLAPWKMIEVVKWSMQGDLVYFFEFKRDLIYDSVFLNLQDNYCYRVNEKLNNFEIVKDLVLNDRQYDEKKIVAKLKLLNIKKSQLFKDPIKQKGIIGIGNKLNQWYPNL